MYPFDIDQTIKLVTWIEFAVIQKLFTQTSQFRVRIFGDSVLSKYLGYDLNVNAA